MGEAAKLAAAVAVAPQRYTLSGRKRTEPEKFIAESSRESNDREDSIRSEARRGGTGQAARPVAQLDRDNGDELRIWPSSTAAAKAFDVSVVNIEAALTSHPFIAYGFKWQYHRPERPRGR